MRERKLSEATEKILARVTNSVAVPNAWAATWAVPQGEVFWFAQADNGRLQPKRSPDLGVQFDDQDSADFGWEDD